MTRSSTRQITGELKISIHRLARWMLALWRSCCAPLLICGPCPNTVQNARLFPSEPLCAGAASGIGGRLRGRPGSEIGRFGQHFIDRRGLFLRTVVKLAQNHAAARFVNGAGYAARRKTGAHNAVWAPAGAALILFFTCQSNILPSREMVMTCHGMNLPLAFKAFSAARCSPPQQGTSIRTMVTDFISLSRMMAVSFSA